MRTALTRRDATRLSFAAICGAAFLRLGAGYGEAPAPPAPTPEFEVTSVKPSQSGFGWQGVDTSPGRIQANSITLRRCIGQAYDVSGHRLLGGPGWIDTDRWEIVARAGTPVDDDAVLMKMLQRLLEERFKLVVHRETRMLPAYVLELGHSAPKMNKTARGDDDTELHGGRGGPTTLEAKRTDMDRLAEVLDWRMDRQVVNRTGLEGQFNFTLHWLADPLRNQDDGADDVSIFTAVREQLGLRLHAEKAPVEVLVIDHAEKPLPN